MLVSGKVYITVEDTFFLKNKSSQAWILACVTLFCFFDSIFWVPTNQQCLFCELTIPKWNADNAKILLKFFDILESLIKRYYGRSTYPPP